MLVYYYEQYFFEITGKKQSILDEVDRVYKSVEDANDEHDVDLPTTLTAAYYGDFDAEIAYIVEQHFRKFEWEDIDREYIKLIGPKFAEYKEIVREKVNTHTVSFGYDEMDIMDRVVFVLWYIEFVALKTPKEIVLNEMIELAKRYGDDKSSKLINGIGHKILTDAEEVNSAEKKKQ